MKLNFLKKYLTFLFYITIILISFTAHSEETFRSILSSIPPSLDPADSVDSSSGLIVLQMFETLFVRDQKGVIQPGLVDKIKISPERDEYTFTLKNNIKFHDNTEITSSDVVYSISRRIKRYVGSLEIIKGTKTYFEQKSKTIEGIKIINDKTFTILLNNSFANLPEIFSDLTLSIVPRSFEKNMSNGTYVGSGPYKLTIYSKDLIELDFFSNYYEKKPDISKIKFLIAKSENEVLKLISEDKIDHTHPFDIDLSKNKTWKDYSVLNASVYFISLNPKQKFLSSIETRKALISIIPFEDIQKKLSPDSKYLVSHFIPLGLPGYIPEKWAAPYSLEYAKEKLKKIHITKPIVITNYLPDDKYKKIANSICEIWKQHFIPCLVKNIDLDQAISIIKKNAHQVLMGKFIPDIPDTSQVLSFFRTDNYIPVFNLNDLKIDEMLARAMMNPSGEMRLDYYRVINRLIYEHFAVVPLQYGGRKTYFIRSKFNMPELDVTGPYFVRIKNIAVQK